MSDDINTIGIGPKYWYRTIFQTLVLLRFSNIRSAGFPTTSSGLFTSHFTAMSEPPLVARKYQTLGLHRQELPNGLMGS